MYRGGFHDVKKATSLAEKICGGREENQACGVQGFVHLLTLHLEGLWHLSELISRFTGLW